MNMNGNNGNGSNGQGDAVKQRITAVFKPFKKGDHQSLGTSLPATAGLSDQQRIFVTTYCEVWNATEAARTAGYKWPGVQGARLLQKAEIRAAVDLILNEHYIGTRHILKRYSELANIRLADFIDEEGRPNIKKIRAKSHLVKKYKANIVSSKDGETVTHIEIELHDSLAALRDIGKQFKMFAPEESELAAAVLAVLTRVLDSTLPKEQAGQVLRRFSTEMVGQKN